jgi:HEPN domain-containing protein
MKHPFQSVPTGSSNITPHHHKTVKNMRMNKLVALFIIALIVSPNLTIVKGQTLTLTPFDAEYEPGEDISISGTATAEANLTLVVVFNSTILHEASFTAEGDGNYSEEYEIPDNATEGVYAVTVSDGGESVSANFAVFSDDSEEPAETDLTVAKDNSKELSENLIEQAEDTEDNVEDAFDELEDEGVKIPSEANSSYLQGIEYLEMAKEDFDEGNYTEASDAAFEAIRLFGIAFVGVQGMTDLTTDEHVEAIDNGNDDEDGEDETGSPGRLAVAIERAYVYWNRLNDIVTRLGEDGFDVTNVEAALDEVEEHLDMASKYQGEGDHTGAVGAFREARKSLGRVHGFIQSKIKERKVKQTEQFLAQFQRRVEKITGVLEGLQGSLEAGKTQRVQAVLRSTAQKLLRLSDSLAGGDLENVLNDMEAAVDELDAGIDELNGEGLSRQIKSANRFEAKIDSLNGSLQRLANAGYNTSELDEYQSEAQNLLSQIEEKLREGDEDAAEELIERAESLIEEAQELSRNSRRTH